MVAAADPRIKDNNFSEQRANNESELLNNYARPQNFSRVERACVEEGGREKAWVSSRGAEATWQLWRACMARLIKRSRDPIVMRRKVPIIK